uniref:Uncharacterized protein n=1 Tax=Arundo donax TaxID=35708 RepID=A0A0A9AXU5_ARUDO
MLTQLIFYFQFNSGKIPFRSVM